MNNLIYACGSLAMWGAILGNSITLRMKNSGLLPKSLIQILNIKYVKSKMHKKSHKPIVNKTGSNNKPNT